MKPTFLVVGAEKCGTSTFCYQLSQHPDVFMTTPKEPHFFSRDELYEQEGMDWYYRLFEGAGGMTAAGEGSVTYSYASRQARVIPRILKHLPDVRLIYLMRHPVRRIESVWKQSQSLEFVDSNTTFASFVDQKREFLFSNSCYWDRINAFREHFPDDRILLLFFEDVTANPAPIYREVFGFLGVDPDFQVPDEGAVRNRSSAMSDRGLVRYLKSKRPLRALAHAIPGPLRHRVLKQLRVPVRPVEWDRVDVQEEMEQLRQQSARVLEHCQRPADFWDFNITIPE